MWYKLSIPLLGTLSPYSYLLINNFQDDENAISFEN